MLYIVVPQTSRNSQIILRISGTGVRMHTLAFAKEQLFLITCKISRSIDLRYGTKKIFLYRDSEISESWQKFFFVSSLLLNFEFFAKFCENFQKTKIFELRKFSSLGRISVPYHLVLIFLRSKRNGSMDGRNFAGA